jgi:hypothetical protein
VSFSQEFSTYPVRSSTPESFTYASANIAKTPQAQRRALSMKTDMASPSLGEFECDFDGQGSFLLCALEEKGIGCFELSHRYF